MDRQKLTYDVQMFKDTFENEFTYLNGFLRNVHRFKERTALTCPIRGQSWSYPQVNTAANKLAHALLAGGGHHGRAVEKKACIDFQKVLTPNIFNGYGSPEAFWNTFLRPFDLPEMAGTAGRSCTDDDMAVVHVYPDRLAEPNDVVPRDGEAVGEVIIRSPRQELLYLFQQGKRSQGQILQRVAVYR
jgi:hypothetical protein